MNREISLSLPLESEYLTTVRLAVGGVCAMLGFDIDLAEDVKVCVTESLLLLKRNGFARATLSMTPSEQLFSSVRGEGVPKQREESGENEISLALLDALSLGAEFRKEGDRVVGIELRNG